MFNLFDIARGAGGGAAVDAMARQFGLSPEQTERAMRALLPALALGLQGSAREPDAFERTLGLMGSGRYAPFFDNPALAFTQAATAQGNEALAALFGSKDVSRQVAREAAAFAGIGPEILKQMLPVLVSILLGGLQRSGEAQRPRREEPGGFFEQILDALRGGGRDERAEGDRARRNPDRGERPDRHRRERQTFPESRRDEEHAGGGWGDILADILRGPFPVPADRPAGGEEARPGSFEDAMSRRIDPGRDGHRRAPDEGRRRPPPSGEDGAPPHGDAFDTWGRMFKAGQEVQEQYAASLRAIFDGAWGPTRR